MIAMAPVVLSSAFNEGLLPEFHSAGLPAVGDQDLNIIGLRKRQALEYVKFNKWDFI